MSTWIVGLCRNFFGGALLAAVLPVLVVLLATPSAKAQFSGQIQGTITDSTGAAVPNANICDSTPSVLLINQHDGTFKDEAVERGVALSEDGMEQGGMGLAVGDLFGEGGLDISRHILPTPPTYFIAT